MSYYHQINDFVYLPTAVVIMEMNRAYDYFSLHYLGEKEVDVILKDLDSVTNKKIIIDFAHTESILASRRMGGLEKVTKNNQLFLINLTERCAKVIEHDCGTFLTRKSSGDKFTFCTSKSDFFLKKIQNIEKLFSYVLSSLLVSYLSDDRISEKIWEKLPSSGVKVSPYINLKRLYENSKLFSYVCYQLCFLTTEFSESKRLDDINDFDELVCVSYAGAVLATEIGRLLNKKVLYLMNLGPMSTLKDRNIANKIHKNKKYLFVADMSCMGTEYKLAKAILHVNRASLIGGITVVRYQKIDEIKPILDVSDYKEQFNYRVEITEN